MPAFEPDRAFRWSLLPAIAAAALPSLLAFNLPPSATFLNQALAFATWGVWAAVLAARVTPSHRQ